MENRCLYEHGYTTISRRNIKKLTEKFTWYKGWKKTGDSGSEGGGRVGSPPGVRKDPEELWRPTPHSPPPSGWKILPGREESPKKFQKVGYCFQEDGWYLPSRANINNL